MFLLPALVTALTLLMYQILTFKVGISRGKYGIPAPATHGHPDFDRIHRVQINTMEQIVFFLPSMWLFAAFVSPEWAAGLGIIWIIGRILYARSYYREAGHRMPGFFIALGAASMLLLGGIVGIVSQLVAAA